MPDLLRVENLAKRFGGIVATDNLDLAIPEGELHAVIGPNGAGKTTLIAQLGGQLASDSGHIPFDRITVLVHGRVITSGQPAALRNNAQVRDAYLGEQEAVHG